MSCIDNKKGNILVSYLFNSDNPIENIKIDYEIQKSISKLINTFKENGFIKKWIVAPDGVINKKLEQIGENLLNEWIEIEENCVLPKPHQPVLVSLYYPKTNEEIVEIDELNDIGNWELFQGYVIAWKELPTHFKRKE